MQRSAQSKQRPRRRSERGRLAAVLFVSLVIVAAGALATTRVISPAPKQTPPSDDVIYTGSILIVADDGVNCHQFLFDNRNGRINDNGMIDCDNAYYQGAQDNPRRLSSERTLVISEGFRNH